jgi:putative ABC transport system substrate-binding protein
LAGVLRPVLAANEVMWVLLSDQTGTYTEAAAALQADWRVATRGRDLQILNSRELPAGPPPAALVTLGSAALHVAMARVESSPEWAHVPVLAALLPREGFAAIWKRPPNWVSAAYLDQPFERYLELIRRAFPRLTRVGVLLGPDAQTTRPVLLKAATDRGLQLVVGTVARPDAMYASLRTVLAECDVLLVLPDSTVADASALQNTLISAYRQRVPVVSFSPALVKAGAALGLYASPAQVGRQVAAMLKVPLNSPNWSAHRLAEGFTITVNEQVSRSLGLDVPDVSELTDALRRQEGLR